MLLIPVCTHAVVISYIALLLYTTRLCCCSLAEVYLFVQGNELKALRTRAPYRRIIYCGDGANDLCPALNLCPGDAVLARKGYDLDLLIQKRSRTSDKVQAEVHVWETHQQLFQLLRKLI